MIERDDNFWNFVLDALKTNIPVSSIALSKPDIPGFQDALVQIQARRKTATKLPSFLSYDRFYFPTLISAEQSTNEMVADYHASLLSPGEKLLDMTAGLGIDSLTFAKHGLNVSSVEMDGNKVEALDHNASVLGVRIQAIQGDSVELLRSGSQKFDWIYVDPARRDGCNRRTYAFRDCTPDLCECLDIIYQHTGKLLVKASPLLDIESIIKEIPGVVDIHIVCVKGECKEILIYCTPDGRLRNIYAVDIKDSQSHNIFKLSASDRDCHNAPEVSEINVGDFIYEPNAAMMKLRCDGVICDRFREIKRVSANTHLFISPVLYQNFPGRVLQISGIPDKKGVKELKGKQFNVCTRNYPLSSQELVRKLKIRDGGRDFIYGFRGLKSKPMILIASPIESYIPHE